LLVPVSQWAKVDLMDQDNKPGAKQSESARDGAPNFGARQAAARQAGGQCRSSDIEPPEANDTTFLADCSSDGDLDTSCTTGKLEIRLKVPRVITSGDRDKLINAGLLSRTARLMLPAYDVDSAANSRCGCDSPEPEFDRITFNGKEVKNGNGTPYLEGSCNAWRLNTFEIPIDWIEFADDPGEKGTATPKENIITIEIDVKNQQKCWCTSVDWVALEIDTPVRPVVMVHGILSKGETWEQVPDQTFPNAINFSKRFTDYGVPNVTFDLDPSDTLLKNLKTIEENALSVGREVDKMRRRWGVEKVNLLCHSKGGLDSREFVQSNEGVDKLVQLGTPNGGSPIADVVQLIGVGFAVYFKSTVPLNLNKLAGPAGKQLTTAFMAYYNIYHPPNPKVSYVSIAGDYQPSCSIFDPLDCPLKRYEFGLGLGLSGRGDAIVPIYSVHQLGYAKHDGFTTRGDNFEATHIGLTKSPTAFDIAWSYLIGPSVPAGQSLAARGSGDVQSRIATTKDSSDAPPDGQPTLAYTAGAFGLIAKGGTQTHTIPISEAKPTAVTLIYPEGNLDLTLFSPSGQRFDSQTSLNNSHVKRGEGKWLGGRIVSYAFASPEIGQWSVVVNSPQSPDSIGEAPYAVNAWIEGSTIELVGTAANPNLKPGESLELQARLKQSGQPITDADVIAHIVLPDDNVREIQMRDDGVSGDRTANDGTYTGVFTETRQPGSYRIGYRATGQGAGAIMAFSREALALATVSRSRSAFTGNYRDYGVNMDGDRFYDYLAIDAEIDITAEAIYRVVGVLTDARGARREASFKGKLSPGRNIVTLKFDGEAIFRNSVDGPYRLSEIHLAEEEDNSLLPVDSRTDVYQTGAYKASDFQHPAILLTGKGSANGVDTNGNGLFDLLKVGVEVNLASAGSYTWSARLTDRNGKELGFNTKTGSLRGGVTMLDFDFNGKPIGEGGVDGPCFLRGLILFGAGASLTAEEVFTTAAFKASQFEGYKINNPVPVISSITPNSAIAGGPQLTLTVKGEKFIEESQVLWNGAARQTIFDSSTQLRAIIPASDLANPATVAISVVNPPPGGGASSSLSFVVTPLTDAEQEPNETSAQATQLSFPGKRTGKAAVGDAAHWYIVYPDGVKDHLEDFFALSLTQNARVELKLTATNAAADLDLFLFREVNGRLSYVGYSITPGADERIVTPSSLPPGRYLVAVSAFRGSSNYTLTAALAGSSLLSLSPQKIAESNNIPR